MTEARHLQPNEEFRAEVRALLEQATAVLKPLARLLPPAVGHQKRLDQLPWQERRNPAGNAEPPAGKAP
jgi:hypothetical protein